MFPTSFTKAIVVISVAACLALVPTQSASAASRDVPPTDKIVVDLVTVNGSGCPAGTAAVSLNADNSEVMLEFSQYFAAVGLGTVRADFRKNCQLNLIIHGPQGYSYAIPHATYRGFAHLEAGASATLRTSYYFQGSAVTNMIQHSLQGQLDDNWAVEDYLDPASLPWSPCGELRNFNINTELRVSAGTSDLTRTTSFITMDGLDLDASAKYDLIWKRCPTG